MLLLLFLFTASCVGSLFGQWGEEAGLPHFGWQLDQRSSPFASWNSTYSNRTDHWQLYGNGRVNTQGSDAGVVQLLGCERGPTWYNFFDPVSKSYGGGFSWLKVNNRTHISAYQWTDKNDLEERTTRTFGVGYFRTSTLLPAAAPTLLVDHMLLAPFGDHPLLIDLVTIANVGKEALSFSHYEYFDVNRIQLFTEWIRTGIAGPVGDKLRAEFNREFEQWTEQPDSNTIVAKMYPYSEPPPCSEAADLDWYPNDVFLSCLSGSPDDVFGDQKSFFGSGDVKAPDAVSKNLKGKHLDKVNALWQPAVLVMKHNLVLKPGENTTLVFAYGYVPEGTDLGAVLSPFKNKPWFLILFDHFTAWNQTLARDNDESSLEVEWRSTEILQASTWRDYYQRHVIAQGSAYLYLHGADGVPRDSALFSMAANWLKPQLSRETLELIMGTQDISNDNGAMTYAFVGHGIRSSALDLHAYPSDLDIFLFLGVAEHVITTGDYSWLTQPNIPFYDQKENATIIEHLRVAFDHLVNNVGLGDNGFIRCGDGDWDDGLVLEYDASPLAFGFSTEYGESVPNTLMAIYSLPMLASVIKGVDKSLSVKMLALANQAWTGKYYIRAWLKDSLNNTYPIRELNLQSQVWALLIEDDTILSKSDRIELQKLIESTLATPIGFGLSKNNPFVWPAISQLYTMSTRNAQFLKLHSYETHAKWVGIMSGPDGFNPSGDGATWSSPVTPMTDYPVSNINGPAMYIRALLAVSGAKLTSDGAISLSRPQTPYTITSSPLMSWTWATDNSVTITYNPTWSGQILFRNSERNTELRVTMTAGKITTFVL